MTPGFGAGWPQTNTSSKYSLSHQSSVLQQRPSAGGGGVGNLSSSSSSNIINSSSSSSSNLSASVGPGVGGGSIIPGVKTPSYKTVLLGDASVGKSSLVVRFVKNTFSSAMETTIGAAFFAKTIEVDGEFVKFEVWDTAGQERFSSLAPMYYRGAAAAVVVYDQTNGPSFERAQMWVQQLQLSGNPDIVIALAANKADIHNKQVDIQKARLYAEENQLLFLETSAMTGLNVQQLFQMIARRLQQIKPNKNILSGVQTVKLTADEPSTGPLTSSLSSRVGCCGSS